MGYNIMVYLGLIYSVYALIILLFEISDFEVYFRIRKNGDNTPLNFLSNTHNMKMCILFILLNRYKYYTYMGMILLLNN